MLLGSLSSTLSTRGGLAIGGLAAVLAGSLIGCNGNSPSGMQEKTAPSDGKQVAAQAFSLEHVKAFELGREWVGILKGEDNKHTQWTGAFRRWLVEEGTRPEGKVKVVQEEVRLVDPKSGRTHAWKTLSTYRAADGVLLFKEVTRDSGAEERLVVPAPHGLPESVKAGEAGEGYVFHREAQLRESERWSAIAMKGGLLGLSVTSTEVGGRVRTRTYRLDKAGLITGLDMEVGVPGQADWLRLTAAPKSEYTFLLWGLQDLLAGPLRTYEMREVNPGTGSLNGTVQMGRGNPVTHQGQKYDMALRAYRITPAPMAARCHFERGFLTAPGSVLCSLVSDWEAGIQPLEEAGLLPMTASPGNAGVLGRVAPLNNIARRITWSFDRSKDPAVGILTLKTEYTEAGSPVPRLGEVERYLIRKDGKVTEGRFEADLHYPGRAPGATLFRFDPSQPLP